MHCSYVFHSSLVIPPEHHFSTNDMYWFSHWCTKDHKKNYACWCTPNGQKSTSDARGYLSSFIRGALSFIRGVSTYIIFRARQYIYGNFWYIMCDEIVLIRNQLQSEANILKSSQNVKVQFNADFSHISLSHWVFVPTSTTTVLVAIIIMMKMRKMMMTMMIITSW